MQLNHDHFPVLIFLVLFLGIAAVLLFIFSPTPPSAGSNISIDISVDKECTEGDTKNCVLDGCDGLIYCNDGKWSNCFIEKVCKPGSQKGCFEGCFGGYMTCNECGNGYEDCIYE